MRARFVTLATVAALALATLEASRASAQARSQRRIPRSGKGAPADTTTPAPAPAPAPVPAVDTAAMRRDSIARADSMAAAMRADSIARAEQARNDSLARLAQMRADSIARADSTARAEAMRNRRKPFFIGIAAGPTFPVSDYKDIYKTGFNVLVPIGLQTQLGTAGARLDLMYNRLKAKDGVFIGAGTQQAEDLNAYSATLNLTAGLPFGSASNVYVFGGGGASYLQKFVGTRLDQNGDLTSRNRTLGHVDGGAGVNFGFGGLGLFLEGRYVSVFQPGSNFNYVPVSLGLRF